MWPSTRGLGTKWRLRAVLCSSGPGLCALNCPEELWHPVVWGFSWLAWMVLDVASGGGVKEGTLLLPLLG